MLKHARQSVAGFFAAALLAVGVPAFGQVVVNDGLVNVTVGDVTILEDVNVALAARVAANICGVNVQNVTLLAQQVDQTGTTSTVCTARGGRGPVTIEQN